MNSPEYPVILNCALLIFHTSSWYNGDKGTRGGVVGGGTALQAGKSRVRFPTISLGVFR
jgi:hypothetical protein